MKKTVAFLTVLWCVGLANAKVPTFLELQKKGLHSFTYDGQPFSFESAAELLPGEDNEHFKSVCRVFRSADGKLELRDTWKFYKNFPAVEVTPELANIGYGQTGVVDSFQTIDQVFPVRGGAGLRTFSGTVCTANDFTPFNHRLGTGVGQKSKVVLDVAEGRSSSAWLPFFGIDFDEMHGIEIGLGWTGGWTARFEATEVGLRVRAGMRRTHFKLLPGETLRQPSILLMRRDGISVNAAKTMMHRFMIDEKLPRDGKGNLIEPLLPITAGGGNKPDGMMLDIIDWSAKNRMPFNTFWVDAGWYGPPHDPDPYPNCGSLWWPYTGFWKFNPNIHPDGNLRQVSDAAAAAGMKFLLWFEPERSMGDMPFAKNHPQWMLPADWQGGKKDRPLLVNLGNPECRDYVFEMLSKIIRENRIGVYRQDFNLDPMPLWNANDAPDRVGVTEAKHIAGLYQLWDSLKKRFPDLLIENCASGGRRIDIETIARSHSYCRTDFAIGHHGDIDQILDVQNITMNTICFQPFQGSETTPGAVFDDYGFFSSVSAGSVFTPSDWNGGIVRREFSERETRWFKRVFAAAARMRTGFMGDFYPQTDPTTLALNQMCGYQMHRPDLNGGFAIVFSRPECAERSFAFSLQGLDPSEKYLVERYRGEQTETSIMKGTQLAKLKVDFKEARDFALVFYSPAAAAANDSGAVVYRPAHAVAAACDSASSNPFRDENGAWWAFLRRKKPDSAGGVWGEGRFTLPGRVRGIAAMPNCYVVANDSDLAVLIPGATGGAKNRLEPGELMMHPEPNNTPGGGRAVLRFTVPEDGEYSINARFRSLNLGAGRVDVSVVLNGQSLFRNELVRDTSRSVTLQTIRLDRQPLKAGWQLDIVVGAGINEQENSCDATAVRLELRKDR
ncbi:MAG: alpha-galactosidase [Kiritimatiellae bacterium]|nr:alpha-galactosidase [Kiritimatiellia bacterium]